MESSSDDSDYNFSEILQKTSIPGLKINSTINKQKTEELKKKVNRLDMSLEKEAEIVVSNQIDDWKRD